MATIYNRGQIYRRDAISAEGDRSDWFAIDPLLARSIVAKLDPPAAEAPERPFRFEFAPVAAQLYLRQRLLVRRAQSAPLEELEMEEEAVGIVAGVLAAAGAAFGRKPDARRVDPQPLAEHARELLATTFAEPLSLVEIADRLGCSPYHLCHCFRRATGTTLHGYRMQLRLRTALERLGEPNLDLTELALDLGYSSHSHFTMSFGRFFGATPSKLRTQLRRPYPIRPFAPRVGSRPGGGDPTPARPG